MIDYSKMPTEELEALKERMLSRASAYKRCQDGSYEMCLHESGYYKLMDELKVREEQQ